MQDLIEQMERRRRAALDEAKALGEALAVLRRQGKTKAHRTPGGYRDDVSPKLTQKVLDAIIDMPRSADVIAGIAETSATTVYRVAKHNPGRVAVRQVNGRRHFLTAEAARAAALAENGD